MRTSGIRIYDEVRAAHLERFRESAIEAETYYVHLKYDVEKDTLISNGIEQASLLSLIGKIFQLRCGTVELNEPFFLRFSPQIAILTHTIKLRNLFLDKE